jgi:hypothetical protein
MGGTVDRDGEGVLNDLREFDDKVAGFLERHKDKVVVLMGETILYEDPPEHLRNMKVEKVLLRDAVVVQHEIKFSFMDRIRILFGCKLQMHITIHTENVVGRTANSAYNSIYVEKFWTFPSPLESDE